MVLTKVFIPNIPKRESHTRYDLYQCIQNVLVQNLLITYKVIFTFTSKNIIKCKLQSDKVQIVKDSLKSSD